MLKAYAKMAQNNAWANATLYQAAQNLPDNAAQTPGPGFFPTLSDTLNHIYEVDLYYLDALRDGRRGRGVYNRTHEPSLAALAALQADADAQLVTFCQNLRHEILTEARATERPDGMYHETVQALLLHLFQHQIHHRGQAHVQLHALGLAPPQLDEFYLEYDRAPAAEAYWS